MNAIDQLMTVARRYGEAAGCSLTTTSWRAFGDGKKLSAIESGADLQTRRFERAMRWFSDNWPENAEWPDGIARPVPTSADAGEPVPSGSASPDDAAMAPAAE